MRKLTILLAVLATGAGAAAFAVFKFDAFIEANRDRLTEQVSTALRRPVRFAEIDWSLLGGFGARITDLTIGEDPAFADGDFFSVARAGVLVKVLPALWGRYEVERIVLDSPRVTVIHDRDGFNFDSIAGKKRPKSSAQAAAPTTAGVERVDVRQEGVLPFLISKLRIRDGMVHLVDRTRSPATETVIDQVEFSAAEVRLDRPIAVELSASLLGGSEKNIRVTGTVGPVESPERIRQLPLNLDVAVGPLVVDRLKAMPLVGTAIPPQLSSPDRMQVAVEVRGSLAEPRLAVSFDGSRSGFRYGEMFQKPKGTRFEVRAKVAPKGDRIEVDELVLHVADAEIRGRGVIDTGQAIHVDLRLSGANLPLAGWGELIAAAQPLDIGGTVDFDVHAVGTVRSAFPSLNGSIHLRDVWAKQPGGEIEVSGINTEIALRGDRIEVPPTHLVVAGEPATVTLTAASIQNRDLEFTLSSPQLRPAALAVGGPSVRREEVLRDVDASGSVEWVSGEPRGRVLLRSSNGSLRDVDFRDLDAEVDVSQRRATVRAISVRVFDGRVRGSGAYDLANPKLPAFSFRGRVDGLDVASLAGRVGGGKGFRMTGKMYGDLRVAGSGANRKQVADGLTGEGSVEIRDGVLRDVNLADAILKSITGVPGLGGLLAPQVREKYRDLFGSSDTSFEELGARMSVADSQIQLREVVLVARDYSIRGEGTVGFDKVLDMNAMFIASPGFARDMIVGVTAGKYLKGMVEVLRVPVRLTGTLPKIRPTPDTGYLARTLSRALASSGITKGLDAILGRGNDDGGAEGGDEPPTNQQDDSQTPGDAVERLLRKGLDRLFGRN